MDSKDSSTAAALAELLRLIAEDRAERALAQLPEGRR